jgi:hypothetical protein
VNYLTSFISSLNCNNNIFVSNYSSIREQKLKYRDCLPAVAWSSSFLSGRGKKNFQRLQGKRSNEGKIKRGKLTSSDDGLRGAGRHVVGGRSPVCSASFAMFPATVDHDIGAGGGDDEAERPTGMSISATTWEAGIFQETRTMQGRDGLDGGFTGDGAGAREVHNHGKAAARECQREGATEKSGMARKLFWISIWRDCWMLLALDKLEQLYIPIPPVAAGFRIPIPGAKDTT